MSHILKKRIDGAMKTFEFNPGESCIGCSFNNQESDLPETSLRGCTLSDPKEVVICIKEIGNWKIKTDQS